MIAASSDDLDRLLDAVARRQAAYARAIDDDRLETWPDFFIRDCRYVVTTADNVRDGLAAGLIYCDSRAMLLDRVSALREANIYERQRYRHLIGLPCVLESAPDEPVALGDSAERFRTETPFMVARIMRSGETQLFATGRYLDTWEHAPETLLLAERVVACDSSRIDTLLAIPL